MKGCGESEVVGEGEGGSWVRVWGVESAGMVVEGGTGLSVGGTCVSCVAFVVVVTVVMSVGITAAVVKELMATEVVVKELKETEVVVKGLRAAEDVDASVVKDIVKVAPYYTPIQ